MCWEEPDYNLVQHTSVPALWTSWLGLGLDRRRCRRSPDCLAAADSDPPLPLQQVLLSCNPLTCPPNPPADSSPVVRTTRCPPQVRPLPDSDSQNWSMWHHLEAWGSLEKSAAPRTHGELRGSCTRRFFFLFWSVWAGQCGGAERADSPCSDAKLSADGLALLWAATASEVLEPPLPRELDVLLLLNRWLKKSGGETKEDNKIRWNGKGSEKCGMLIIFRHWDQISGYKSEKKLVKTLKVTNTNKK